MAYKKTEEYDEAITASLMKTYKDSIALLGEDPEREGLLKTPERVAKAMQFITQGYSMDAAAILNSASVAVLPPQASKPWEQIEPAGRPQWIGQLNQAAAGPKWPALRATGLVHWAVCISRSGQRDGASGFATTLSPVRAAGRRRRPRGGCARAICAVSVRRDCARSAH